MTVWIVLLIILLIFWLISLIRVGGRVRYGEAGLFAFALAGPLKIQLFPTKPKEEKPKKKKKPKKAKHKFEKPKPEGQPGTLSRLMQLLPVVGQVCGALKRKIRIDDLKLELICEAGRLAVPGRPMQFRTTKTFLRSFGLSSLDDLPELPSAAQEEAQLTLQLESALQRLQQAEGEREDGGEAEP